jgi:hypothetical protein
MESENVAALRDPSFEIGDRIVPESRPDVRGPEGDQ